MGKRKGSKISALFCNVKKAPLQNASKIKRVCLVKWHRTLKPFVSEMEQFWLELCSELSVLENVSSTWLDKIKERYSRTDRSYHNMNSMFLTHKLPHLQLIGAKDSALAMASIFQYLEYRPKTDLTLENCDLFREFAAAAGLDVNQPGLVAKVLQLLGAQHAEEENGLSEADLNFFQDLDLAVLGSNETEYAKYRELLRLEFPELTDEAYNAMRLKLLQSFLMIPMIYTSEAFASLEFTARANIEKEVAELST